MLDDRFWTKVDKSSQTGCWEWRANKNNKGYGLFRPGGTLPKRLAHRLAYEDARGHTIPKGRLVLHSCDNPSCVNPAHLRLGSHKDNVADMDARRRRVAPGLQGETVPTSKLTEQQVIALRRDYVSGVPFEDIARRYGISKKSVTDYTSGRSWRHILGVDGSPTLSQLRAARRTTPITEETVRRVWELHFAKNSVPTIAKSLKISVHSAYGIVRGRTWRHLPDAPSIVELKKGGVPVGSNQFSGGGETRDKHPKSKIPASEISTILRRIDNGETLEAIGQSYGVTKATIWRTKQRAPHEIRWHATHRQ